MLFITTNLALLGFEESPVLTSKKCLVSAALEKCRKTVDPHRFREVFVRPSERALYLAELNFQLIEFGPSVRTVVSPLDIQQHGVRHLAAVLGTFYGTKVEILDV